MKALYTTISVFIALILALALIGTVSDQTQAVTTLTPYTETINIAPARLAGGSLNTTYPFTLNNAKFDSWRADDSSCRVETIVFKNQTGSTMADPTNYVFVMDIARLTLKNTANLNESSSNTTTASYNYCNTGYLASAWQRTVLNLVPGFFALAILGIGLFFAYTLLKENGIV